MSARYTQRNGRGQRWARASIRSIIGLIVLLASAPAYAQATLAPNIFAQFFDSNGDPLASGRICVFEAGTSTLATTYLSATISPGNAQTNPIVLNSAGRPSSGGAVVGIWLTPGASYKFVLKDSTTTTCVPDTGVTLITIDNVNAIPGSSVNLDVTGTAGESLSAGDLVYKSTGASGGGANAGQWYKADADLPTTSTSVFNIGMAVNAITSGATGTIRLAGAVTVSGPLTPGAAYYASATAGEITATPPTNAIRVGQATSTTMIDLQFTKAPVSPPSPPCGRLTLTTGTPVTTSDVSAAGTLYYTPYRCNQVSIFNGTQWTTYALTELSIAVPAVATQLYDVFVYDNAGVLTLELTAWTNDTTRATALTTQNGVYVRTGATSRLYLGSVRTVSASQLNDTFALRHVWNYYNRVPRPMRVIETTDTWNYDAASYRQARATAANQLDVVVGVAEVPIHVMVVGMSAHDVGSVATRVSIGEDSTTTPATTVTGMQTVITVAATVFPGWAELRKFPAVGRHVYVWLEYGAGATTQFYGDNGSPTLIQSGISGVIEG